ncbi:MAG: bifunctional (p)ppGpp synthetase/guanosine-3',5'-bis(diphosphate) 3'-pyrophosphohydrolase [Bacteroidales bacterium]|nr:bifunctional (p)ppGpp synthetase/guanosine-3',5'-bis(diphosphate) 3'-pyrophosphohydrolase [Bacteroidales bacterium]MCB9013848.1 bifunctional (p)ppGpp synthetase/guanosine-3',5'-bis(diphosphate) 3'-pyrophosphohydrolase [Bacteroidales bacterium]
MKKPSTILEKEIVSAYQQLIRECKALSSPEEMKSIREAFEIANQKCMSSPKKAGSIAILNSLSVARIVAREIGLGGTSVIAALIADFVNEKDFTLKEISEKFGDKVTEISTGLYRISNIKTEKTSSQAENLRNLILTLASDVRVILIKLAERLHHMRSLENLPDEERISLASETRYIYSPLAHRLGLYNIMSEMEDISMKYLEPEPYSEIFGKLKASNAQRTKFIAEFIAPIEAELKKQGIKAEIKGRQKAISSIWKKMKSQKVEFEEIYDKFAIRIIIDTPQKNEKADCWKVFSIITDFYTPNTERMRDWISVPRSNGYESLHATVVVPGGNWVEVQIRSQRMDEIAEKGFAAHWKYKGIKGEKGVDEWLAKVRELLENPDMDAANLIDDFKLNLYAKEIFVFTPNGDLKKFPEGATVLDFAFEVHTAVGASCVGAKVNGKNVPIRYPMKNGDRVEIIRSKTQKPKQDWTNFVVTSKAKSKIKLALKEEKLKEAENGKEILKRRFKNWKLEFNDPNIRKLIQHYKYNDSVDMYYDIATEKLDLLEIKLILSEQEKTSEAKPVPIEEGALEKLIKNTQAESDDYLVIDNRLSNVDYHLGKCCNPILGDSIFGFVTIGSGITIHRLNCPNAGQLISKYGYRVVKARWRQTEGSKTFLASIRLTGVDDIGIVSNISDVIAKDLKVNMRSISIDSNDGMFEGTLSVFVSDTSHLDALIKKISRVKGVMSVKRIE